MTPTAVYRRRLALLLRDSFANALRESPEAADPFIGASLSALKLLALPIVEFDASLGSVAFAYGFQFGIASAAAVLSNTSKDPVPDILTAAAEARREILQALAEDS